METVTAPSFRAQLITRRTYSRPKNDQGTEFESWTETVDRVVGHQRWLWERAKGAPLDAVEDYELGTLRRFMLERKLTTSGRTLWLGGTDTAKTREASQFNPLPRREKFITKNGVMSFLDFEEGDETTVLTHTGKWRKATIASAGIRKMLRLRLSRGTSKTVVDTCVDHTWILNDASRVIASELKVGDRLHRSPAQTFYDWSFDAAAADEQLWWCYGFVYGDGTIAKSGNSETSRVRLCGNKEQYLPRFRNFGFDVSFPPSCDSDPIVYTGRYLKTLPEPNSDPRLIRAFLRGYLDADGNKATRHGRSVVTGIVTTSNEAADFITKWMPVFGVYISADETVSRETNLGTFSGREIRFTTFSETGGALWTVEAIEPIQDEECWCLTVENDHSFVLPQGVVTGNCSFEHVETIHDVVDAFWLLLQGCGVGGKPINGILNGFVKPVEVQVIRSTRTIQDWEQGRRGLEHNDVGTYELGGKTHWHLTVGDSAAAWAKAAGKLLAMKQRVDVVVLDFSQVRAAGIRLKGYGWISSGDETVSKAFEEICNILSRRAGKLLRKLDILDVMNWLGTTLSSRRSAEIMVMDAADPEAEAFAVAKKDHWANGQPQRAQSNNSLIFYSKPTKLELKGLFQMMMDAGGSEPGFINGEEALRRAPWFKGVNPCAEILLGNKSFCNLVEVDMGKFLDDPDGLMRAVYIAARANYRQTCVDLRDGVLSASWHELNEFLRLCGVGLTGIVKWLDVRKVSHSKQEIAASLEELRWNAQRGVNNMADELGLPHAKAVTTVKPSGTLSKIMDTTEGVHRPLGKYIFNNVNFSKHDPLVPMLKDAGYRVFDNPYDPTGAVVTLPVAYEDVAFTRVEKDGVVLEVNTESAIEQLERYKLLMQNYVDHNCSITVSYDPSEVPQIVEWLYENWDSYVGVSWLYRNDPTKTAEDLGFPYLPQQVVTEEVYREYVAKLQPINLDGANSFEEIQDRECATGACPIR